MAETKVKNNEKVVEPEVKEVKKTEKKEDRTAELEAQLKAALEAIKNLQQEVANAKTAQQ